MKELKINIIDENITKYYEKDIFELNIDINNEIIQFEHNLENVNFNEIFKIYIFNKINNEINNKINNKITIDKFHNYIQDLRFTKHDIYKKISYFYEEFRLKEIFNKNKELNLELKLNKYKKFFDFEYNEINCKKYIEQKLNIHLNIFLKKINIHKDNIHYNKFFYYIFDDISLLIMNGLVKLSINELFNYIKEIIKDFDENIVKDYSLKYKYEINITDKEYNIQYYLDLCFKEYKKYCML